MSQILACHDCDLVQTLPPLAMGMVAQCPRCGAILRRTQFNSINRTVGWLLAGVILYALAVSLPFLAMQTQGVSNQISLTTGIVTLYRQGMGGLGLVVLLTCLVVPLFTMLGLLYVLLPLLKGLCPPWAAQVFALTQRLKPWGMMEVYMLAILISMIKLAKMASLVPGPALYSLIILIFVLAAALVSLDSHLIWEKLTPPGLADPPVTSGAALISCEVCHLLLPAAADRPCCPRCGVRVSPRKPNSLSRCWALVLSSAILWLPANLLPVTITQALGSPPHADTIMSGVIYFFQTGSWHIALIIFIASLVVPIAKLMILVFLLLSLRFGWRTGPRERTRLYRLTEIVGRWSMVDVYVVSILVALVRLGIWANIKAGPGIAYFAALVILTMFAANSFDPRLIWDQERKSNG
ncbi:MAG: paraquat-inducible protein A [Desulfobacteraceae bacterium]|nr:paraquat-inducible protein A [Desulfobacteraceae bacterium]